MTTMAAWMSVGLHFVRSRGLVMKAPCFSWFLTKMMETYPISSENINQCKSRKCFGSGSRKIGGFGIMYDCV